MGELRHTCICLCARCESLGSGAFGAQPDGAEPLQVEADPAPGPLGASNQPAPALQLALMLGAPTAGRAFR
jgi:hypothetical protein